ncbi:hypothetical protein Q4561_15585 [Alteromonas sp. 1_MG-2023]|nr:hypothetical protein [Alteromonas sp. 1_MG-2023]MDO6568493.1 hypothetical protein [Alteromonas sp. 1_MG-2023]
MVIILCPCFTEGPDNPYSENPLSGAVTVLMVLLLLSDYTPTGTGSND